jgi:polysaccharide biosynthesis transport protein
MQEGSQLTHQLQVLKRGAWIVLLVTALVTAAAIALSLRQESLYRATADVFVGSGDITQDLTGDFNRDPVRTLATQASIARLPVVAQRMFKVAKIQPRAGILSSFSVQPSNSADFLTFEVVAPGPKLSAVLATSYAKGYTQYRTEIDTAALREARKRLTSQLDELQAKGANTDSALFATLEQRRAELGTVATLRGSRALVVRGANLGEKIQPKPTRNAILGALLGLFLGIAIVLLRDALNTRARTVEEVQRRLELPLLARIPDFDERKQGPDSLVMLKEPRSVHAEAFRILATNVEFANAEIGARTIMITSANRAEGKSTVVANLAGAFARRGKHVVLVDLDLRRPTAAKLFGINQRPGVTDVALGHVDLEEALVELPLADLGPSHANGLNGSRTLEQTTGEPGTLEVLPSGTIPSGAGELAGSSYVAEVIDRLAERADIVLLDAPPILQVGDTLALSTNVDSLLAVTRLSEVRRSVLDELHRVLESAPVVKIGLIVTGVSEEAGYGYGYGYNYGHANGSQSTGRTGFPGRGRRGRQHDRVT